MATRSDAVSRTLTVGVDARPRDASGFRVPVATKSIAQLHGAELWEMYIATMETKLNGM